MKSAIICPYLGTHRLDGTPGPAQDYPSFENVCFAVNIDSAENQEPLLLPDQATFCLGSSHRICPRYQALHGPPPTYPSQPLPEEEAPEWVFQGPDEPEVGVRLDPALSAALAQDEAPRPGAWLWATALLAVFLLFSGGAAVYVGWQLVTDGAFPLARRFEQLAQPAAPPQEPVFILVTATPEQAAVNSPVATPTPTWTPTWTPTFEFPEAVTPTPVLAVGPVIITTPTPLVAPAAPGLATAVAGPVIITTPGPQFATPTRRPTPPFAVPSSTPGEPVVIVVTATPTEPLPTPVVEFRSAHQALLPGGCTILSWKVENVRAVFYENEGVYGTGEKRECIKDKAETFTLSVLLLDGTEQNYTVTVDVMLPTPTPTFTPTFTPVFTPTPTWTPAGTPIQTPAAPQYGVFLAVDGGNQASCSPGTTCEYVLQLSNRGSLADEIFLNLAHSNPTPVRLCRPDGSCGETVVSLGIGAGDTLPIYLRVTIPADQSGKSFQYQLQAASGNSGHTIKSDLIILTVHVP